MSHDNDFARLMEQPVNLDRDPSPPPSSDEAPRISIAALFERVGRFQAVAAAIRMELAELGLLPESLQIERFKNSEPGYRDNMERTVLKLSAKVDPDGTRLHRAATQLHRDVGEGDLTPQDCASPLRTAFRLKLHAWGERRLLEKHGAKIAAQYEARLAAEAQARRETEMQVAQQKAAQEEAARQTALAQQQAEAAGEEQARQVRENVQNSYAACNNRSELVLAAFMTQVAQASGMNLNVSKPEQGSFGYSMSVAGFGISPDTERGAVLGLPKGATQDQEKLYAAVKRSFAQGGVREIVMADGSRQLRFPERAMHSVAAGNCQRIESGMATLREILAPQPQPAQTSSNVDLRRLAALDHLLDAVARRDMVDPDAAKYMKSAFPQYKIQVEDYGIAAIATMKQADIVVLSQWVNQQSPQARDLAKQNYPDLASAHIAMMQPAANNSQGGPSARIAAVTGMQAPPTAEEGSEVVSPSYPRRHGVASRYAQFKL